MDEVIRHAEEKLMVAKNNFQAAENRLNKAKQGLIDGNGNVRQSIAQEVGAREISLKALRDFVTTCEKELQHSKDDEPRRDKERKLAQDLITKAEAVEAKVSQLREELEKWEGEANSIRVQASNHLVEASATIKALQVRMEDEAKAKEKAILENRTTIANSLASAKRSLEIYQSNEDQTEDGLKERQSLVESCERDLAHA